jgi:hypothetical protein
VNKTRVRPAVTTEPCPVCPYSMGLVEGPGGAYVTCERCGGEGSVPIVPDSPSLLSPGNQRPVPFDCACGATHSTDVPWLWEGVRRMWLVCPKLGQTVSVVVDCSPAR